MTTSNETSSVGVVESAITRLPTPDVDGVTATDASTRVLGDDSEYGDDVIRIRLVFDGDDLRQIMMVDPAQNEVEWVRADDAPAARISA